MIIELVNQLINLSNIYIEYLEHRIKQQILKYIILRPNHFREK